MGLEQGGQTPSGNEQFRSPSNRLLGRLPWFEARLPRFRLPSFKEITFRIGTAILTLTGLAGMNPPEFNPLNMTSRTALAGTLSESEKSVDFQSIPLVSTIRLPDGSMGIFDRRANGMGDNPATNTDLKGYIISGPVLDAYKANGGDSVWGPPVSKEFKDDLGRINQVTQRGVYQVTVDAQGRIVKTEFSNIFDGIRQAEVNLDDETNMIPGSDNWDSDKLLKFGGYNENGASPVTIEDNHFYSIFTVPRAGITSREQALLKRQYLANGKWFEQYGLPMGIKKYQNGVVAVVAQRAALHLWPDATPWSQKDVPVVVNGGDVLKKLVAQGFMKSPDSQVFATQENPSPQGGGETVQPTSELRYVSPKGYVQIEHFPDKNKRIVVVPEAETSLDDFLMKNNIRLSFQAEANWRRQLGDFSLMSCPDMQDNRCFSEIGNLRSIVDPITRTITISYYLLDKELTIDKVLAQHNGYLIATLLAQEISLVVHGARIKDIEDNETRLQASDSLMVPLRDEIKPFEVVSI